MSEEREKLKQRLRDAVQGELVDSESQWDEITDEAMRYAEERIRAEKEGVAQSVREPE